MRVTPEQSARLFVVYDRKEIYEGGFVCTPNAEKSRQRVIEEHRPGGRVTIVNEDLFAYEPEQPFHAFSQRAYQGFPPERREELARRFFRWLHPGGLGTTLARAPTTRTRLDNRVDT
jgi:hypothetical protein